MEVFLNDKSLLREPWTATTWGQTSGHFQGASSLMEQLVRRTNQEADPDGWYLFCWQYSQLTTVRNLF